MESISIMFSSCVNQIMFSDIWKKSNICPMHEKDGKQKIINYRPVSLLPICWKIFEILIFSSLYENIEEKN